jgi:hypothetical protein
MIHIFLFGFKIISSTLRCFDHLFQLLMALSLRLIVSTLSICNKTGLNLQSGFSSVSSIQPFSTFAILIIQSLLIPLHYLYFDLPIPYLYDDSIYLQLNLD